MRRLSVLVLVPVALGLGACESSSGPRPLVADGARLEVVTATEASLAPPLRFGCPMASELAPVATFAPGASLALRVRFLRFRERPRVPSGVDLDDRVHAVIDPTTGASRLAPVLAGGGIFLDADAASELDLAQAQLLGDVAGALPDDATVRVSCYVEHPETAAVASALPALLATERVAVLLRRRAGDAGGGADGGGPPLRREPGSEPRWVVDLVAILETREPPPSPPEPWVPTASDAEPGADVRTLRAGARSLDTERRELLALRSEPIGDRASFGIVVPSPFEGGPGWIAVLIDVKPAPGPADPEASLHALAAIAVFSQLAGERARVLVSRGSEAPSWIRLRARGGAAGPGGEGTGVELPPLRATMKTWSRRGLALLASETGAHVALEVALAADLPTLTDAVSAVEHALDARQAREIASAALGGVGGPALAPRALALDVDLAALGALLRAANRDAAQPIIERLFGAAFVADLAETGRGLFPRARAVRSHAELVHLVVAQNLLALEDTRPPLRIVAARWLAALVPGLGGYDPFGPFEERRRATDELWRILAPEETP